jgi:hypothetical protein
MFDTQRTKEKNNGKILPKNCSKRKICDSLKYEA